MPRKAFQSPPFLDRVIKLWLRLVFFFVGYVLLTPGILLADETLASRVIVLANSADPESVRLAHYYAEQRRVPEENIIALPLSSAETINWRTFIDTLYQPLQDILVQKKWIDAIGMTLTDKLGRKKYAVSGHHISYLVVCRGVPLRIDHDQSLYSEVRPMTDRPEFRTNAGAVDAELSLLPLAGYPINAYIPNPLFRKEHPLDLELARVIKVSRLDGPTYADAAALVDHALQAEKQGLIGRAYVDIGGPIPDGDAWFEQTARELEDLGFDLSVDRESSTLQPTARFDAPALYFGWYAWAANGPFTQPEFRFPPGAIALHLHSFSAQTLRSGFSNWCGPLVARGVTATFGNVYEPYLPFTHYPFLIVQALVAGKTLGDAAYFALPALSWEEVVIGDPLYRPFAVGFAEQWSKRASLAPTLLPYVITREMKRLCQGNQIEEAIRLAHEAIENQPSPVTVLALATLLKKEGRVKEAIPLLGALAKLKPIRPSELPLLGEAAQILADNGRSDEALAICNVVLKEETLSLDFKSFFAEKAAKITPVPVATSSSSSKP